MNSQDNQVQVPRSAREQTKKLKKGIIIAFCIMLALNERKFLETAGQRRAYCGDILSDPMLRRTSLGYRYLEVSWKQKVIMLLVRLRAAGVLARI